MNTKYTKNNLMEAVSVSESWSDVCRYFGLKPYSGSHNHLKKRADRSAFLTHTLLINAEALGIKVRLKIMSTLSNFT